ncbi:MAG: uroporphyrinogen decarboxylase [Pseudoclavibacter sp.]
MLETSQPETPAADAAAPARQPHTDAGARPEHPATGTGTGNANAIGAGNASAPALELEPLGVDHPLASGATAASPLVRAAHGERGERLPIWFMRQAGRSLPEYRRVREGISMLDSCLRPDLAAEITLQPVRRHGVDGAVFFSDIVVPLKLVGEDVEIVPGRGPVFANPVRTSEEAHEFAARVRAKISQQLFAPITEAVGLTVAELGATPLIGFAGAPFTVAAYVVEGGPSKDHLRARTLMQADPEAWLAVAGAIAELSAAFLEAQVRAGASIVQLFDSWAGSLSAERYRASVAPSSGVALERVRALRTPDGDRVRTIHFGVGTAELLRDLHGVGADVQGVDDRITLAEASARLGGGVPLQGNIDPAALGAGLERLEAHAREVVRSGFAAPAHIVNLGHGVPPEADPEVLTRLVEYVHTLDGRTPPEA